MTQPCQWVILRGMPGRRIFGKKFDPGLTGRRSPGLWGLNDARNHSRGAGSRRRWGCRATVPGKGACVEGVILKPVGVALSSSNSTIWRWRERRFVCAEEVGGVNFVPLQASEKSPITVHKNWSSGRPEKSRPSGPEESSTPPCGLIDPFQDQGKSNDKGDNAASKGKSGKSPPPFGTQRQVQSGSAERCSAFRPVARHTEAQNKEGAPGGRPAGFGRFAIGGMGSALTMCGPGRAKVHCPSHSGQRAARGLSSAA